MCVYVCVSKQIEGFSKYVCHLTMAQALNAVDLWNNNLEYFDLNTYKYHLIFNLNSLHNDLQNCQNGSNCEEAKTN